MINWAKTTRISYKQWRDDKISVVFTGEGDIVGHNDEDQCTDYEICTTTTQTVDQSAPQSGSNKTEDTFTVEDAVGAIGFGKFQWKLSLLAGLSWMADSMEMMVLSVLAPQLHCEWRLPSFQVAFITSVVFIGMGISSSLWGNICDKYGRKLGLTLAIVWTTYYGLLSAFAPTFGWIVVLRGLVGFGIGGLPQSVTLYSEFLPMKRRAASIMLIQIFWATGAVVEVLLAMWIMPTLGWRWLLGVSIIPLLVFVAFSFWLPESAHFDVLIGNRQKALATLTRIAADNGQPMPQGTLTANKQESRGRITDLFTPYYRRTTLLVWFLWFANALSYYGIILLTTELFQAGDQCGVTPGAKTKLSCSLECKYLTLADYKDLFWTTLAEFPGLFVVLLLIDWVGRKKSMALCFIMFTLCVLPLYACIGRTALTILIFIARAFISGGYQVVFVYTPEVFPTETRAIGMGTSSGMARVGALLTPFVSQVLLKKSVYLALSVYCACSLLAAGASLCLPIETLGRGLQESSQPTGQQEITRTSPSNDTAPIPDTSYGGSNQEQAVSAK